MEKELDKLLPRRDDGPEGELYEAMRYAVLAGGKRVRPFLVMASSELFDVPSEQAVRVAAAVECIHSYSLIHDDLPCMDDDDLRRGRPTVHVKFDEATAVLAGDALLTYAFELVSDALVIPNAQVRIEIVGGLAKAAGARGMVGGQILDIAAEKTTFSESETVRLQRLKTGEMIAISAEAGAILGRGSRVQRHALQMYAHDLGLAFQIADDLLDVTGTREQMGKAVGKDRDAGKATFVALLGIERATARAKMLADQAAAHLEIFGKRADSLRDLCNFVVERNN
jgi:farnesyl diphosphate synthase